MPDGILDDFEKWDKTGTKEEKFIIDLTIQQEALGGADHWKRCAKRNNDAMYRPIVPQSVFG